MTKASFSFILRVSNFKGKPLKVFFFLLVTTMLVAAPKKKAQVSSHDDDFVPLKKSSPNITPAPTPLASPQMETTTADTPKAEVSTPKAQAIATDSEISEVLISKLYLKVSELNAMPKDYVQWDDRNGKSLFIPKNGAPYILLMGRVKDKHSLSVNNVDIPLSGGNFEYKLVLPSEPTTMKYRIKKPDGKSEIFDVNYTWIKNPGSIRVKVKEDSTGDIVEKSVGYSGNIKLTATTQLTADGEPATKIDSIQHKKLSLVFRITSPQTEEKLESWALVVKNNKKESFSELKKNGTPPSKVEWNDFMPESLPVGKYTYRVSLFTKTGVFDGPEESFEAVEGKTLSLIASKNTFSLEPKEEIGYLTYKNYNSYNTSSLYVGTELPVLLNNRYILRPGGMLALPTADPENSYYSARALLGIRLTGEGQRLLFFKIPYEMQMDILFGLTRFSLSSRAPAPDFNHLTLMIQPDLVIGKQQYITPLFEYSADTSFKSMRMSVGLVYQFYIKAWSLKWGTGFVYDNLFQDSISANKYSLFRALSSFQFQL